MRNIAQIKKNKKVIESDHNSAIIEFNIKVEEKRQKREEIYNFRNKHCQKALKEATEDNKELIDCFEDNLPFEKQCKNWNRALKSTISKSFRKVRIVKKKKTEKHKKELFEKIIEKKNLKNDLEKKNLVDEETKRKIEERIEQIENEIEKEVSEDQMKDAAEM